MDELRTLKALQVRFNTLNESISDEKVKEYFLRSTKYWMGEAEAHLANNRLESAACMLAVIAVQLSTAEKVVITYGSGVTINSKSKVGL